MPWKATKIPHLPGPRSRSPAPPVGIAVATAVVALALGWGFGRAVQRSRSDARRQKVHAVLSTLRTFEEGYALRLGAYVVLPDSCREPEYPGWEMLGTSAPSPSVGCFRVEGNGAAADSPTAPSIRVIAESAALKLRAVEGNEDSAPTWTALP